jgi:signal transduction histidine kinase
MPFAIRGRLAIVVAVMTLAVMGVYSLLLRAQLTTQFEQADDAAVMSTASALAGSMYSTWLDGTALSTRDNPNPSRPFEVRLKPLPPLRATVDSVPGYVWVLDRVGAMVYNSAAVRDLPESDRTNLDSVVANILPGVAAIKDDSGRVTIVPTRQGVVRPVTVDGRRLLLYGGLMPLGPTEVNHVVVGRFSTSQDVATNFGVPFLLVIPLVGIAALVVAGLLRRIALQPVDKRIDMLIDNVEAVTDGRSLHRRLAVDEGAEPQIARLAETLNAMIERLERSFSGLRRFTADASHELKTPLTVLRADVERAMSTKRHSSEQMVALEEALAETTRMADLVESLLTLARADEGRFDLHREPVDLEALARDVFETAVLLGEPTSIEVRMNPPTPVTVQGDRARLRQLFLNLVTNAIKYTPARGAVELSLTASDSVAQFSVRDTGIGIAAADLEHVFERFWRADRARSRVGERGGFGLGLAISQYIAQAHGGSLTVLSRLGRGTTFTATLPLSSAAESPNEK